MAQDDFFKIEFDQFSPNEKMVIEMMENNPAEPFEGVATNGEMISFETLMAKPIVIWVWDVNDEFCKGQVDGLNLMNQIFSDRVHFVGLAYDKKPFIDEFTLTKSIDFPILPESFRLGELHYGSELGQGRVFLVNTQGIVQKAIPRSFFMNNDRAYNDLKLLIENLLSS